jgi:hypothetical protein
MSNFYFTIQPGEFIELNIPPGSTRIGRILSVYNESLSVTWWVEDVSVCDQEQDAFFLPKFLAPTADIDVIPKQSISSLVFVFHARDVEKYKVRYVYGMKNIFITNRDISLATPFQSISYIVFDSISRISSEIQRMLSNRRGNQFVFSSTSVAISELTWIYLVQRVGIQVHNCDKVCTVSAMRWNDLSQTKVKSRVPCKVIRLEDNESLKRLISIFGNSAVVGVRKPLPALSKRLGRNDVVVSERGGVQMKDVINLIDVASNDNNAGQRFSFNAHGRKGIDFIFFPSLGSLRICVRYNQLVVSSALQKLNDLGIAIPHAGHNIPLTDAELERLLRG